MKHYIVSLVAAAASLAFTVASDPVSSFADQSLEAKEHHNLLRSGDITDSRWSIFGGSSHEGVTLKRTFKKIPRGSYIMVKETTASHHKPHCKKNDRYGSNNCNFNWGDTVEGTMVLDPGMEITKEHEVHGKFTIDRFVHWNYSCAACGKDCTVTLPVIDKKITMKAPPCSLFRKKEGDSSSSSRMTYSIRHTLSKTSLSEGVKMHVVGTIHLATKVNPKNIIAEMNVDITMK